MPKFMYLISVTVDDADPSAADSAGLQAEIESMLGFGADFGITDYGVMPVQPEDFCSDIQGRVDDSEL